VFGGKVDFVRPNQEKLKGFHKITMLQSQLWGDGEKILLRSHREAVTELPNEFMVIGKSQEVAIDAMKHQSLPIWSVQTHPEATSLLLKNLDIEGDFPDLMFEDGNQLVQAFLDFCLANYE